VRMPCGKALIVGSCVSIGLVGLSGTGVHTVLAAEGEHKITVNATGSLSVKPDVAEVSALLKSSASMASEALKKFRANRRRAVERFKDLKLKDLTVDGSGPTILSSNPNEQQQGVVFFNGNANVNPEASVMNVMESLVIRLPSLDRMKDDEATDAVIKIVDAAKDAGLSLSAVQFRSTKLAATKTAAVQAAMQAARQKAELLAAAANVRLGPVLAVQQIEATTYENGQLTTTEDETIVMPNFPGNVQANTASSKPLAPISVRASLNVEFGLERGK